MPLPEADETATYERIQTKKIQYPIGNFLTDSRPDDVLTQEQFQIVKNQVTIQETNEDELRRLNLVGTASNQSSLSGPFRNIVVSGELTSTGYLKLQPDLPGMYQLSAVDAEVSGGSGTQQYELWYGNVNDDSVCKWFYMSSGDSGVILSGDANYPDMPMWFDENLWLTARLSNIGGGLTKVTFRAVFTQFR